MVCPSGSLQDEGKGSKNGRIPPHTTSNCASSDPASHGSASLIHIILWLGKMAELMMRASVKRAYVGG